MATYGHEAETEGPLKEDAVEDDPQDEVLSQSYGSAPGTGSAPATNPATANTPSPHPSLAQTQTLRSPQDVESATIQDVEMQDYQYPELHHHLHSHHISNDSHTSPSLAEVVNATEENLLHTVDSISPSLYHDFAALSPTQTRQSFTSPDKPDITPNIFYDPSSPFTPSGFPISYASPGVLFTEKPIWPLKSSQEARLMRFFVDRIAPAIDLCDRDRHFTLVVPQRASQCPILLNAVFAAAARHLAGISDFDPIISNRYNQECLKHLIPKLSDAEAITDENLLAATVILRHLEELEGKSSKQGL